MELTIEEVEQPTLPPFIAFMVRLPHKRLEDLTTLIVRHGGPHTQWLIAKETDKSDREHFHGIVFMEDNEYDKVQRHFRETWNLKGNAKKGETKEYGRVRRIKDRNKMLSYTVKDGNVITSENWDIDLEKYIEASYKKPVETNKQLRDKELKDNLLNTNKKQETISTKNIRNMPEDEFKIYAGLCSQICRIYLKYNCDQPVIKTINRLLVRYGWMEVENAIHDHLSSWFSVRDTESQYWDGTWKENNIYGDIITPCRPAVPIAPKDAKTPQPEKSKELGEEKAQPLGEKNPWG